MTQYPPPGDSTGGYQPSTPSYGQADQTNATGSYGQAGQTGSYGTPSYGNPATSGYSSYAAPKPKSDKKTFGLWALILGISSIIIPLGLNGLAGVALGIVGLIKENSKGMSITGIVTGALGFIWSFFFWPLIITLVTFWIVGSSAYYYY